MGISSRAARTQAIALQLQLLLLLLFLALDRLKLLLLAGGILEACAARLSQYFDITLSSRKRPLWKKMEEHGFERERSKRACSQKYG
jgi:hypothetical protein